MNTSVGMGGADRLTVDRTNYATLNGSRVYTISVGKGDTANFTVHFVPTPELLPLIESLYQLANFPATDVLPSGTNDVLACNDCGRSHE